MFSNASPTRSIVSFSWDLIWARGCGLWTLPRLWKTREARGARVAFGLGEGCELVTNAAAAFSTIAWKTLRVSHERPQAPADIYKKESFIWNKEGASIYWRQWKTPLPGFEESSVVVSKVLNHQGGGGVSHSLAPCHKRARVCS